MNNRLLASVCVLFALSAGAQVQVGLVTEQKQFLPGEALRVGVRIVNFSGQTLKLGEGNDWIWFHVEPLEGVSAKRVRDLPVDEPFEIKNADEATRWFDLAPYYDLSRPGRYRLSALVKIKQWNEDRHSPPVPFEIVSGTRLWEQRVGVPPKPGQPPGPPAVRKYIIQKARLQDGELKLYLRVTDEHESAVFRVTAIDRLIQIAQPEWQIDRDSNLHVLHQSGMKSFNYSVFNPDGELLLRQRHDYNDLTGSRPRLDDGGEGRIIVRGGVAKETPADFPPSKGTGSRR